MCTHRTLHPITTQAYLPSVYTLHCCRFLRQTLSSPSSFRDLSYYPSIILKGEKKIDISRIREKEIGTNALCTVRRGIKPLLRSVSHSFPPREEYHNCCGHTDFLFPSVDYSIVIIFFIIKQAIRQSSFWTAFRLLWLHSCLLLPAQIGCV